MFWIVDQWGISHRLGSENAEQSLRSENNSQNPEQSLGLAFSVNKVQLGFSGYAWNTSNIKFTDPP